MTVETVAAEPLRHEGERDILARYAQGRSIDAIVSTGYGREQVSNAVMYKAVFDRGRAAHLVREFDLARRKEKVMEGIEELLAAAEKSGVTKAIRLAGRIRQQVRDLDAVMKSSEKERELLTRMSDLRQQLDTAEAALRTLKGKAEKPAKAKGVKSGRVSGLTIRQWARANNIECPGMGPIPKEVRARYEQAHGAP